MPFWEAMFFIAVAFIEGFFVGSTQGYKKLMKELRDHIKNCHL